ncbi:MAG: hypothetical protein NXH88_04615 [Hyphomonas sp.]|nr:hypothetical protein [Hyphomonas sp.]
MDVPVKIAKKLDLPIARDNPEYAEAIAKRTILRQRASDLQSKIDALSRRLAIAAMPLNAEEFSDRVSQALASKDGEFTPMLDLAAARMELSKLKSDHSVVVAAHREQRRICGEMADSLSVAALTKIEAQHKRAVAAIAQAMDDLRAAVIAEKGLRADFREAGYSVSLPSFHMPRLNFYARDWGRGDFVARVEEYLR